MEKRIILIVLAVLMFIGALGLISAQMQKAPSVSQPKPCLASSLKENVPSILKGDVPNLFSGCSANVIFQCNSQKTECSSIIANVGEVARVSIKDGKLRISV